MDSKSAVDSFLFEEFHHFSDGILSLGHTESVSGSDDDVSRFCNHLYSSCDIKLCVCSCDLHRFTGTSGLCAIASQDNIGQRSVHGLSKHTNDSFIFVSMYLYKGAMINCDAVCHTNTPRFSLWNVKSYLFWFCEYVNTRGELNLISPRAIHK